MRDVLVRIPDGAWAAKVQTLEAGDLICGHRAALVQENGRKPNGMRHHLVIDLVRTKLSQEAWATKIPYAW